MSQPLVTHARPHARTLEFFVHPFLDCKAICAGERASPAQKAVTAKTAAATERAAVAAYAPALPSALRPAGFISTEAPMMLPPPILANEPPTSILDQSAVQAAFASAEPVMVTLKAAPFPPGSAPIFVTSQPLPDARSFTFPH